MRLKSDLLLFVTAFIWGSAFSAQRVAAQHFGTFFFNGSRFLLAVIILLPFSGLLRKGALRKIDPSMLPWILAAGVCLYMGSALQQAGLQWTTAANAGFITGLYVVIVPVLVVLFWRQKVAWTTWAAALVAVIGVKLLSSADMFSLKLSPGDGLELIGALFWALHVILVGRVVNRMNVLHFAIGQYLVCAVLQLGTSVFVDLPALADVQAAWWTIAYVGIFSVAIGYTLQAVGQKHSPPADAALILSMESVFAALFGFLLLHERLAPVQVLGCVLIFAAVALIQLLPGQPNLESASLEGKEEIAKG
jgi:drug/metabolite transporter (DMT)-like permease